MTGIGLSAYLNESSEDGKGTGGGNYVGNWKDKGHVIYWLHTAVLPVTTWSHSFLELAEFDEKDKDGVKTGQKKQVMRYPRFNSPDPKEVHANQFFRDKGTDRMRTPPQRDVFLILREYLRLLGNRNLLPLDQVVFEWQKPKDRSIESWRVGELSGIVKRGQSNFGHSLDTKYEGIYLVVVDGEVGKGLRIAREGKLLCEKIRELVRDEIDSNGVDAGDPTLSPYAIKCIYTKDASPANSYRAIRYNSAEYTQEIYDLITKQDDLPDIAEMVRVQTDDDVKIRAAMEAACQIELPFDLLFGDLQARRSVYDGDCAPPARTTTSGTTAPAAAPARPPATPGAARPPATGARPPAAAARPAGPKPPPGAKAPTPAPAAPAAAAAPAATPTPGSGRRRIVDAPAPPPQPAVEMIPCDVCSEPMDAKADTCPKCGAKYQVDADPEAEAEVKAPPSAGPKPPPAKATGPKPPAAKPPAASVKGPKPPPAAAPNPDSEPDGAEYAAPEQATSCFVCQSTNIANNKCNDCGQEQGDDIPF